jgi:hypothetical protein
MFSTKKRYKAIVTAAVAAVLGAGASGAVTLAAASSSETINACARKKNGQLRLAAAGKCRHSETAIRWNVSGPTGASGSRGLQGPQGIQGIQGNQGVPGQRGPSDGYGISKPDPTGAAIPLNGSYTTVASETVPAGSYYASEDVEFNGTAGTEAFCYLTAQPTSGSATYVGGGDILAIDQSSATSVSGSSSGLITTPTQSVLAIRCASIGSGAASIQRANLAALAAGAAH